MEEQAKYAAERGQEHSAKSTRDHKNEDEIKDKDNEQEEAAAAEIAEAPFENYIEFIRHLHSKPFEMLEKERRDTVNGLD